MILHFFQVPEELFFYKPFDVVYNMNLTYGPNSVTTNSVIQYSLEEEKKSIAQGRFTNKSIYNVS